ncbi:MAG TPA: helix-turn-helix transcriptional regulator [Ktedonobacteraceae bacterium]|nr:helix-turn-helix transcriptional regulator [Ktedonobacteraceae bacterium]
MASIETTNVGKAVAARVGSNIREVRTKMNLTQAQLASPEFSISYISAIERGKIRPSLKALSILAKRLDVPLTFLLEGTPAGAAEARAVGYSPADSGPDLKIDVDLLLANVLIQQQKYLEANDVLTPIHPERITTDQAYRLFLLRGQVHLGLNENQEAVVDLRQAVTQGEGLGDVEYAERARNLLGKAYFLLYNYTLAMEHHLRCANAIESNQINDPVFALEVFSNLAQDYFRHGEQDKAVEYYYKSLATFEGMGRDSRSFAERYMDIGRQYKEAGKTGVAYDYIVRSLAIYDMRDEQRTVGITHQRLGKALEKLGDLDGAEAEYQEAITIEEELEDNVAASTCHTSLAELYVKRGNIEGARREAEAALEAARRSGDAQSQGQALIALAQLKHNAQEYEQADELFTQALDLLDSSYSHELAGMAYSRYANMLEQRGEVQRSLAAFKKAYQHQLQGNRGEIE